MIVLDADDYAMSDDIDRAITALADAGRLSATSVMTNMTCWPAGADALAARRGRLALGLHLNLSEGRPLSSDARRAMTDPTGNFRPLSDLIWRAWFARLNRTIIAAEVRAQLDAFTAALGHLPDFIDGHQHVHVLPGVRDGLFTAVGEITWPALPLVRTPTNRAPGPRDPISAAPKRAIAGLLGAGFRTRLAREGLPTNDTFAGFSTFQPGGQATGELSHALQSHGTDLHLVMCHPACPTTYGSPQSDPLAARRIDEFNALMAMTDLTERIWRPTREADGTIDWFHLTRSAAARRTASAQSGSTTEPHAS